MPPTVTARRPVTSRNPTGADLLDRAGGACSFAELLGRMRGAVFEHVTPAAQPFVAALCARRHGGRTWVIVPDLRVQENVFNDLVAWHGAPGFFPQLEAPAFDEMLPDPEVVSERLAILHALTSGSPPNRFAARDTDERSGAEAGGVGREGGILVVVADSLDEDVPAPQSLRSHELRLAVGDDLPPSVLIDQLDSAGYERVPVVSNRGQFAVRGGIIDVFSWQAAAPIRVEFFDVRIESLREFDVDSQVRTATRDEAVVLLNRDDGGRSFAKLRDYIGPEDLVIALDRPDCADAHVHIVDGVWTGESPGLPSRSAGGGARSDAGEIADTACYEHPLGNFGTGDFILQEARRSTFRLQLEEWHAAGWMIVMFFNNEGEIERFREIFSDAPGLGCRIGQLNHGFTIPAARLAVLSDAELFGRYQHARARRLFNRERREFGRHRALDLKELEEGGLVVHQDYGIARYRGIVKGARPPDGSVGLPSAIAGGDEVLVLEFAGQARLYVSLDQAHLVSRYVGTGKTVPALSKLGDEKWSRTRRQAERSILEYAGRLLAVQAERDSRSRAAHPADNKWQWEFENAFIYQETPDQLRAIHSAKADMESGRPMDRLICGDVGFGKTEVAIRAAFKCVMGGRQVAILAPTTVLAEQHWRTLRERMSDYPVRIDLLCRWRTAREQNETVRGLIDGSVDIVVGTHRLLSKDVAYKSLGLVVVDEEQRFGVRHKEEFKQLFRMVDVLTLSATPIPRTLYMALMGARDMSTLETAPPNRVPVRTHVCAYDERVIRDAIERELKRGGQGSFLHNRVADIDRIASKLRALCPRARIDVGHGQMDEDDLEDAMKRFVEGTTDVFVCTTIIESGIDIPNANTIIINRADRFGLADLYQLRGRVGRAGHQAYAYLMLPRELLTTTDARKRISAIKQYSTLGAGLKIAMRDLEIRGAGNLLGTRQSGHIFNIGFDLYCQLLKRAVSRLSGSDPGLRVEVAFRCDFLITSEAKWPLGGGVAGRVAPAAGTEGEIKDGRGKLEACPTGPSADGMAPAFIPVGYIDDSRLRIAAYKAVAEAASVSELKRISREWRDRFGPVPEAADNLLRIAELKIAAAGAILSSVEIRGNRLMLTRRGDFLLIAGKFPRLTQNAGRPKLLEAIDLVKKL